MDNSGAVEIVWNSKDENEKVTKLGASKRNCSAVKLKHSLDSVNLVSTEPKTVQEAVFLSA